MTENGNYPRTVAFLDFGTNSIRLLVTRLEENHAPVTLHNFKETVRLGEGEFAVQRLQPHAMRRAVDVAKNFAQVARSSGASEIVAVATAATREASNRQAFIQMLRAEAGIDVRIVSGLEEARLVYLGVASGTNLEGKQALFVDIGGGSTEVIVGTQHEHTYLNSMKLGAIRVSGQFLGHHPGPVSPAQYEEILAHVRRYAARTMHDLSQYQIDFALGSSGTIENLTDVTARMTLGRPWQRGDSFSYLQVRETIRILCSLPLRERRKVPGLNPNRADIFIGGVAIIDVLMQDLHIPMLRFSERGLRDGLLADYLMRHGHPDFEVPLRERSVLQLGRRCRFDEPHARHVALLALQLFDSAKELGLHNLGDWERELLDYAALLHHIGAFVSYSGYQRHSYYLVHNADPLGFDETEKVLIANALLYHRGSLPRKRDTEFTSMEPRLQHRILVLSTLVRLAENLDRSQAGHITSASLRTAGGRRLVLDIEAGQDPQVELIGLRDQREVFERVFGRPLEIARVELGTLEAAAV
jgi:exopolyphosphatase/guanosine-5'-triphosphate,3'-diphosphate pyrophosphatase